MSPPWSENKANIPARILAFIFLLFIAGTGLMAPYIYFAVGPHALESIGIDSFGEAAFVLLIAAYMSLLFLKVVACGVAPKGWWPW